MNRVLRAVTRRDAGSVVGHKRILVVDDEEVNRAVMRTIREEFGHHVEPISDSAAALDMLPT